jgi:hypothetical protein
MRTPDAANFTPCSWCYQNRFVVFEENSSTTPIASKGCRGLQGRGLRNPFETDIRHDPRARSGRAHSSRLALNRYPARTASWARADTLLCSAVFVFIMGSTLGVCGAILHATAAGER